MRSLREIQSEFLNGLLQGSKEKAHSRYRKLVATNHANALEGSYPVTKMILGSGYFKQLAWLYLQTLPPSNPDLNYYGDDFYEFVKEQCEARDELASFVYLPELVRFEWAIYIAGIDGTPSLLENRFSTLDVWRAHQGDEVKEVQLEEVQENVIIWSRDGDVLYQAVGVEVSEKFKELTALPLKDSNDRAVREFLESALSS